MSEDQLEIDWNMVTEPPRARRSDPISSHIAADKAKTFLRGHARLIVNEVLMWPGVTAVDLGKAEDFPLTTVQIDRRTKELEDAGWLERCAKPGGIELYPSAKAREWQTGRREPEVLRPSVLN